ncbi:MAG: hypothetical protein DHS20C15_32810 [Planctomycetota bacterium]|nr:MAG: hypothetical protein DHS20C15_32810 [Planctomycetota bacterium]
MFRSLWAASSLALLAALSSPAAALQAEQVDELPGYYQFYKRTGDMAELEAERTFAAAMEAGEYEALHPGTPLVDLALPTANGVDLRIRRNLGKRNTLLVTFRSWW